MATKSKCVNENAIQLSDYQPEPTGSPAVQNGVNLALQGEGVNLAKAPANLGSQGIADTPPLGNSAEPGNGAPDGVNLKAMTFAELKLAYKREYNSWRSRKHDCKKKGGTWSPEWNSFKGFFSSNSA